MLKLKEIKCYKRTRKRLDSIKTKCNKKPKHASVLISKIIASNIN